ncbi:MAG: pentapeptide repeat-containing protein, partial [Waterburya sp.]
LLEISWVINTFNCTGCTIAADFYRKSISRAQLSNTTLRGSNFQGADLCYALLNGSDCRGVNFSHARLHEVNAVGADFRQAQLHEAVSRGGNFTNVRFDGAATRRFFVTPSESIGFMAGVTPISNPKKHPVQTETALGQSLGRINRMILDFHQDLPNITRMMLDTLVVLLVIFVAAKVKEAQSESRLIDSAGATLAPLEQQQEQQR